MSIDSVFIPSALEDRPPRFGFDDTDSTTCFFAPKNFSS